MIKISKITIEPQVTTVGHSVTITVIADDVSWQTIKDDFTSWDNLKTLLTDWSSIFNYH